MNITEDMLLHGDKLLFAVDLVDHIIIKTRPSFADKTVNIIRRADCVRDFTYNRFNKTIKKALSIIDVNQDSSVYSDFEKMQRVNRVTKESFIKYANKYRKSLFPDGFHAKSFLMYCDRVANMAGYFISYGIYDAAEVAVESILQAFPESVMFDANWSKLIKVAETLQVLGNNYYRDDLSSDSSSEPEDQMPSKTLHNTSDFVNMDMDVSSPEEQSENIVITSSLLKKKSGRVSTTIGSFRKITFDDREVSPSQSSDSLSSSVFSSVKYSSSEASH